MHLISTDVVWFFRDAFFSAIFSCGICLYCAGSVFSGTLSICLYSTGTFVSTMLSVCLCITDPPSQEYCQHLVCSIEAKCHCSIEAKNCCCFSSLRCFLAIVRVSSNDMTPDDRPAYSRSQRLSLSAYNFHISKFSYMKKRIRTHGCWIIILAIK